MGELCLELAAKAADAWPSEPEAWRPAEPAPSAVAEILGSWWFEGHELVFRYRGERLEAKTVDAPAADAPSVFVRDGDDRFRVISGPERGELLRVVRDEHGRVVKLYWATYPFTRAPHVFGG